MYCIPRYIPDLTPLTRTHEACAMSISTKRSDHPLSMRLPPEDLAVIDRAAVLRGRSRTDFVRDVGVRAAEEVLLESTITRMSPEAFEDFTAAIVKPSAPVPEMVELFRRKAPWE
jgi:uncharacterized protein (DUF1778 family)